MSERARVDEPLTFDVDLKWSLWSKDADTWKEYAPSTYQHLADGIDGGYLEEFGGTLTIYTSPRKEDRSGMVAIHYEPETGDIVAHVSFTSYSDDESTGIDEYVTANSTHDMLVKIDNIESDLIDMEKQL